jgi:hypothetical protein
MIAEKVEWPEPVLNKLRSFTSQHFSPEEIYDYIVQLIIEAEDLLLNQVLSKSYIEESGVYKGFSRIVIKKSRIYFKLIDRNIVVAAVLFPGEK